MSESEDRDSSYTRLRPLEAACADPGVTQALTPRGEMLVVNKLAGKLEFYRVDTRERLAAIEMPKFPHEVLLARDHRQAYISIYGQGVFGKNFEHPGEEVVIIDLDTRARAGSISTLPYKAPHGMAFDAAGMLWVSCDVSGVILVIDPAKREILKAIPTGSNGTHWLTITPDDAKLYASNKTYPNLVVVDTARREVAKQIPLAPAAKAWRCRPTAAAFTSPRNGRSSSTSSTRRAIKSSPPCRSASSPRWKKARTRKSASRSRPTASCWRSAAFPAARSRLSMPPTYPRSAC
ncbi:MAG TPA: hypothetical protein VH105_21555 [Burkholderiales bacterium]|jgi:sugar lactone lactonase YvrE|nr:hypothetical protein [Burkholderiales bacterium]